MERKSKPEEILEVENLYRDYKKYDSDGQKPQSIKVLKGLNFTVKKQEFVGIMGKSGCGKTTLLKTLGLIDKPTKGQIYFGGRTTRKLWEDELADARRRRLDLYSRIFTLWIVCQ